MPAGASDVRRLKQLHAENPQLKKLVTERDLEVEVVTEPQKIGERAGLAGGKPSAVAGGRAAGAAQGCPGSSRTAWPALIEGPGPLCDRPVGDNAASEGSHLKCGPKNQSRSRFAVQ